MLPLREREFSPCRGVGSGYGCEPFPRDAAFEAFAVENTRDEDVSFRDGGIVGRAAAIARIQVVHVLIHCTHTRWNRRFARLNQVQPSQ